MEDLVSYERGCGISEEEYNGETETCESYVRFSEEHHYCVCQESKCNGANSRTLSYITVIMMIAALARFA